MDPEEEAVAYNEFMALARDEGLVGVDVLVVQAPGDANGRTAVVQATARTAQGSFGAVGEASPLSAPTDWHPFLTTLAELRAKARALRELTGLDHPVLEELGVPYLTPGGPGASAPPPARHVAAPTPPGRGAPSGPALPPRAAPTAQAIGARPAEAGDDQGDDQDDEDAADEVDADSMDADERPPMRVVGPASRVTPTSLADADSEPPADVEGIGRDMEAKLLKLALSIAELEGEHLSEAEARQKLDDFFVRAFKHPLSRATRMEGQRVVQRLSGDLVRLRTASAGDKE